MIFSTSRHAGSFSTSMFTFTSALGLPDSPRSCWGKFYLAGCCSRGSNCNFAHSQDALKDLPVPWIKSRRFSKVHYEPRHTYIHTYNFLGMYVSQYAETYIPIIWRYVCFPGTYIPLFSRYVRFPGTYIPIIWGFVCFPGTYIPFFSRHTYTTFEVRMFQREHTYLYFQGTYVPKGTYIPLLSRYVCFPGTYIPLFSRYVSFPGTYIPIIWGHVCFPGTYIPLFSRHTYTTFEVRTFQREQTYLYFRGTYVSKGTYIPFFSRYVCFSRKIHTPGFPY